MSWTADGNGIKQTGDTLTGDAAEAISANFETISTLISAVNTAIAAANTAITALQIAVSGSLTSAHNLSDLGNVATARTNLQLGTAALKTVGTAANDVVALDGSAKLPAVDGSQLTNLPSSTTPTLQQVTNAGASSTNAVSFGSVQVPTSTTNSTMKVGSMELQAYSVGNSWIAENMFFNGTGFTYRVDGYAAQFYYFTDGEEGMEGQFRLFPHGTAGSQATGAYFTGVAQLKIGLDGTFAVGPELTTELGSYTGSTFRVDPSGSVSDSSGTASGTSCHADSFATAAGTYSHADSFGATSATFCHANTLGVAAVDYSYASGRGALTHRTFQKAWSSYPLASNGDSQKTLDIMGFTDPNVGSQVELFVDGNTQTTRYDIPVGTSCAFTATITGHRQDGGAGAMVVTQGMIANPSGTASIVGGSLTSSTVINTAGWTINVTTDGTNLQVLVTGDGSASPINWVASIESVETHF